MIIELGHFALVLALAAALTQMLLPAWGAYARDQRFMAVAGRIALKTQVSERPLKQANEALADLRRGAVNGALVLMP